MFRPELEVSREQIADFCRRHHIQWLAVFGSALRDDFGPESDVDVLVEFASGKTPGLAFFRMQDELSDLVGGRPVDLATVDEINRWIRGPVLREARVLWSQDEGGDPRARYLSNRTGSSQTSRGNSLMDSRDLLYLGHMLDTARQTQEMLVGIDRERFDGDMMAQLALTRLIEVIGEAARRVSPAGRAQLPGIPWQDVTGMRHRIVHDYLHVDLDKVWETAVDDLPALIAELSRAIPPDPPE
jgi:uncharacterized protein with HEPN domain/predicted nucleotidyltransferase